MLNSTADAWLEGRNALPVLMSMKTEGKLDMKRKTEDRKQQLTPILDNNNDKKFLFLAEQTNPDYRPVKEANNLHPQSQHRNTSSSADIPKVLETILGLKILFVTVSDKRIRESF